MAEDQSQNVAAAQQKVKELTSAVKGLTVEAQRLQANLNKLHEFQASLMLVSQHWMEWMERSNKLQTQKPSSSATAANNIEDGQVSDVNR